MHLQKLRRKFFSSFKKILTGKLISIQAGRPLVVASDRGGLTWECVFCALNYRVSSILSRRKSIYYVYSSRYTAFRISFIYSVLSLVLIFTYLKKKSSWLKEKWCYTKNGNKYSNVSLRQLLLSCTSTLVGVGLICRHFIKLKGGLVLHSVTEFA
jgi:hypothetical protein